MNTSSFRHASTTRISSVARNANRRGKMHINREFVLERLEERTLLAAVAPPSGIVSWWTGDNTAVDLVGPNHGTLFDGAGYAPGQVAEGFDFDGVNDNLQAPTAGLPIASADRTLELWARIDQQVAGEAFFASYGSPGSFSQVYTLGTLSDGRVFVSTWGPAIFGPALQNGHWYHVAATNVGQSFKLYLDGAEVASGTMDIDTPAGSTFWMGRQTMTSIGDYRRLDGMVDEVTVYDRALSASEIRAIYDAGSDGKVKSPNYFAADFPSVVEGQANSTIVTFTVSRVGSLTGQATVDWATADGTATADSDYVAASGQVVFEDGESQKTVDVTVNGDDTPEPNETFNLVLSTTAPGYAVGSGQATILTDDVTITISDDMVVEGDQSTRFIDAFVGQGSGDLSGPRGIVFGSDGFLYVASGNTDQVLRYDAQTGAFVDVAFSSGDSGVVFDLPWAMTFGPDGKLYVGGRRSNNVIGYDPITDTVSEFIPSGGNVYRPAGLAFGPDGKLYVSNSDAGSTDSATLQDQVVRFQGPGGPTPGQFIDVFISQGDNGLDNNNGITFEGDSLYVCNTRGNSVYRYDRTSGDFLGVFVAAGAGGLSTPSFLVFRPDGFLYVNSQSTHQVLRYDGSTGAFADAVMPSGSGGLNVPTGFAFDAPGNLYVASSNTSQILRYGSGSQAVFTVSLSFTSASEVTVSYETADGSATAGTDYTTTSGMLTFAPGQTTRTILVQTLADTELEPDETFTVNLTNPIGATFADAQGTATILDPGHEIHVNTTTAGSQVTTILPVNYNPQVTNQAVAADSAGNFVVVWSGNGVGDSDGIFFQRYDSSRNPLGGETRANVTTANAQTNPVVGRASSNGKFVIAWNSNNGVYGRVFNSNGSAASGEITVAAGSSSTQNYVDSIAVDADGDFVVLYKQFVQKGIGESRYWQAQRFNAAGQAQGQSIRVTTLNLINGQGGVASDSAGNFVVVWNDGGVNVQRYNSSGKKIGSQILVSSSGAIESNVGRDADGDFVVTWGNSAQIFNKDGSRRGGIINFAAAQGESIAVQPNGNFVLSWTQSSPTTSSDVYAQRFDLNGVPLETVPTRVNQILTGNQEYSSVAVDGDGDYVVAWNTPVYQPNGPSTPILLDSDVRARLFDVPSALTAARGTGWNLAPSITGSVLQPIFSEAARRWRATGLSPEQSHTLDSVRIEVADLGGATLGLASGNTIWLDDNAAGWGWFIDRTPRTDREFHRRGYQRAQDHMDLLTVLAHEIGHVLGLGPAASDSLMGDFLDAGERRLPDQHDHVIAQLVAGNAPIARL